MIKATLFIFASLLFVVTQHKLLYALSFIRHGAIYPKNDLYDGNQTKEFRGLLTGVGMRQQYNLGTYLKQTYITEQQITTPKFDAKHVQFFTSFYQRTRQSANSFIYGFFPLEQGYTIPEQVPQDKLYPPFTPFANSHLQAAQQVQPFALKKGFQPLPVRPLDVILDNCPNYGELLANRLKEIAPTVAIFQNSQSIQIGKMKSVFNLSTLQANVPTISDLYETLVSDRNLGRPLPSQYNQTDQKNVRYIYEYYNTLVFSQNFARVLSTPAFLFLRSRLDDVINGVHSKKLTFVFAHHSNLLPLVTLMNLTSTECLTHKWRGDRVTALNCMVPPPFSSNLIFQLHQDDSKKLVIKIKYNGEYAFLCERKQLQCQFNEFVQRVKNIQTDFQKQCKTTSEQQTFIIRQI